MRSFLRFSLLLSLSVVDVNEEMAIPIKSHKEPPDHKMDIKVGLHLDHVLDGDVCTVPPKIIQIQAHLAAPSVSTFQPLSSSILARLSILRTLSTPSAPTPSAHTLRTHSTLTARSAHPQHLSTLSTAFMHNVL